MPSSSDRLVSPVLLVRSAGSVATLLRALLVLAALMPGSVPPLVGGPPMASKRLDGRLRIVGSRAMTAPVTQWVALFRREHPEVRVSVALWGTGTAAAAIRDDLADVAPMNWPLSEAENALFDLPAKPLGVSVRGEAMLYLARNGRGEPSAQAAAFARIARRQSAGAFAFPQLR